jgi:putative ABC transport system substrate-binding protein
MRRTAEPLKLKFHQFGVREPGEFEAAFTEMAAKRVGAVVIIDDATLYANAPALARVAAPPAFDRVAGLRGRRWPVVLRDQLSRHVPARGDVVDKILKGAKPSDLPVERSTKFETIVNLKTAIALGIEVSTSPLLRADEVIE